MNDFEREVIKRLSSNNKILKHQNNSLHKENEFLKDQINTLLDDDTPYINYVSSEKEVDMKDYTIIDDPVKQKEDKLKKKTNSYKKVYKGFKKMGNTLSTISTVVKIGKYAALLVL